jgi:hypothetical protein
VDRLTEDYVNKHLKVAAILAAVSVLLLLGTGCDKLKSMGKINIPGNVAGQVLTKEGAPLGYISIRLVDTSTNKEVQAINVEDNGGFMFNKVNPGEYTLKTFQTGDVEIPNDCTPFKLDPGKTVNRNVIVTLATSTPSS